MKEEDFFLTWNDYSDHMKQMLQDLIISKSFTDVTLVCDDKIQLEAHKIILISCSKFFEAILNPLTHMSEYKPIIYLKGISHNEMESILQFMYLGEARFSQERTREFLRVATELELKSICQDAANYRENNESQDMKSTELHDQVSKDGTQIEDHMIASHTSKELVAFNSSECQESENVMEAAKDSKLYSEEISIENVGEREQTPNLMGVAEDSKLQHDIKPEERFLETVDEMELKPKLEHVIEGFEHHEKRFSVKTDHAPYLIKETDIKYECNTCSECFSDELKLKVHNNQYHQSTLNLSCWCGFQAEKKSDIDIHKLKSHKEKSCTKCNYTADTYSKIFQHFRQEHKNLLVSDIKQEVPSCDKSLVLSIATKKSFSCNQCDFEASKKSQLKQHSNTVHRPTKFACNQCDFKANCKRNLKEHSNVHHISKIQKKCKFCEFTAFDKSELKTHLLNIHKYQSRYRSNICEHCKFKATNQVELTKHLRTHHSKYQCEKCKYFSYSKVKYDRHLEMKHSGKEVEDKVEFKIATNGEKTFVCKECHYKSHTSTNVKRHITTEHLGVKYPCDQCGKEFTNNSNLHQHIKRRHTKNFSWQCDQCEKQFQYEYKLKLHIGDKHLGIKHPCSKCKSAFPDIRNLRKHFQKYHS